MTEALIQEFERLEAVLRFSACAKKQIAAGTYVNGVFRVAANRCEFEGAICPRLSLPSGTGYELCRSVHAEAQLAADLSEQGMKSDGIAWVLGHYWACEPCASALRAVGVVEIRIREKQ